jgi:hypothetical protein
MRWNISFPFSLQQVTNDMNDLKHYKTRSAGTKYQGQAPKNRARGPAHYLHGRNANSRSGEQLVPFHEPAMEKSKPSLR